MRWSWAATLLVLPLLGGCLDVLDDEDRRDGEVAPPDLGYDPESVRITGVEKAAYTIPSFDETELDAVVYAPLTGDTLADGSPPTFGVVVFLHGWGVFKEQFEGTQGTTGLPEQAGAVTGQAPYGANRLQAFAEQGLIAVAYDARGFGRSGGTAMVASAAEMQDLDAVLDFVDSRYATSGLVGVLGQSYGGGQAFLAWTDNPRITTAAPQFGWVDLYEGLVQGDVPKTSWGALEAGLGVAGGKGMVSPDLAEWLQKATTRTDLDGVEAEMDLRSALPRMPGTAKPLLLCQGLQETLFPQADLAWKAAGGFTRALIVEGGHGVDDDTCWARTLDWMLYFVGGRDTGVHGWPALSTVDAAGGELLDYPEFPRSVPRTYYLRDPTLANDPSDVTFTVSQRLLANPFTEPVGVWDQTDMAFNQVPEQMRQDPTAVFFETPAFTGSEVLLGSARLHLYPTDPASVPASQVTAVLFHVDAAGKSRVLSHAAVGEGLAESDTDASVLELRFWWTKADVQPGDKLVLKVGANEPNVWMPLLGNYELEFTGQSSLDLPFFQG